MRLFLRKAWQGHHAVLQPNLPIRDSESPRNGPASIMTPGPLTGWKAARGKHRVTGRWISNAAVEALDQLCPLQSERPGLTVTTSIIIIQCKPLANHMLWLQ